MMKNIWPFEEALIFKLYLKITSVQNHVCTVPLLLSADLQLVDCFYDNVLFEYCLFAIGSFPQRYILLSCICNKP